MQTQSILPLISLSRISICYTHMVNNVEIAYSGAQRSIVTVERFRCFSLNWNSIFFFLEILFVYETNLTETGLRRACHFIACFNFALWCRCLHNVKRCYSTSFLALCSYIVYRITSICQSLLNILKVLCNCKYIYEVLLDRFNVTDLLSSRAIIPFKSIVHYPECQSTSEHQHCRLMLLSWSSAIQYAKSHRFKPSLIYTSPPPFCPQWKA